MVPAAAGRIAAVDVIAKVRQPSKGEIGQMRERQTLISIFCRAQNAELLAQAKEQGITAIAMDAVLRISCVQDMDMLSSIANIASYRASNRGHQQFRPLLQCR